MHGFVKAAWFNSYHMVMAPDLLVWTRASMQLPLMKGDQQLHAQHIGLNRETRQLKDTFDDRDRIARTIICQPADDMAGFSAQLTRHISPFAIVVDMTPFGYRESPRHVAELMEEHFPDCPILFLGSIGDLNTDQGFCLLPSRYVMWRQHTLDPILFGGELHRPKWQINLTVVPDHRLSDRLVNAARLCKDVHGSLPIPLRKDASDSLYRVFNTLQGLAIPYEFYEAQLNTKRRGGVFPIKPLRDWLSRAKRAKLPTGELQISMEQAITALEDIIDLIKEGKTGKYQALIKWIDSILSDDKSGLIIVGSQTEAEILRSWLVTNYLRAFDRQKLSVLGARSVREIYRLQGNFDHALVISRLWPEDLWVVFAAKHVTWLSYPGELHYMKHMASKVAYVDNANADQKAAWWWLKPLNHQSILANQVTVPEQTWSECSGEYFNTQTADFSFSKEPNWLTNLFNDIPAPEETVSFNAPLSQGELVVTTELGQYRFDRNESLQILVEEGGQSKVDTVAAHELQVEQRLILLYGEDQQEFSLFDCLIDYVKEDSQEEQITEQFALRWFDYLDGAMRVLKNVATLQRRLKDEGVDYPAQTIQRWLNRTVITPQKKDKVIPVLAKLSGLVYSEGDIKSVINAVKHVLGLHIKVGKLIKQAMLAEIEGAAEIRISGKAILLDELRARYGIETVQSVYVSKIDNELNEERTLISLLEDAVNNSGGHLNCTTKAYKSAEESPFKILDKVDVCLKLMCDEYYKVWAEGGSLNKAIEKGRLYGIEYRGDTSSMTKGLHKDVYFRTYNGKKIDIGKHLNIGDSRNPERCLRIHFHFDADDQQIVIHHIGRHLPVANG